MKDKHKTKEQLIKDLEKLRQRVDKLKKSETGGKNSGKKQLRRRKLEGVLEMAGAVCHEMNQPMQIILGNSDLLLMHMPENKQLYDKINKIRKGIDRMRKITSKIKNITKYETKDYIGGIKIIDIEKASNEVT
jgi:signal transduction histidine kinase